MTLDSTNQHLLSAVGVSYPSLDYICCVVDDVGNGAAATKLTGAGGSGCAMTLLRPNAESTLSRKLQVASGKSSMHHPWSLSCLTSTVGGDGIWWTDPNSFDEEITNKRETVRSYRIPVTVIAAATAILATKLSWRK